MKKRSKIFEGQRRILRKKRRDAAWQMVMWICVSICFLPVFLGATAPIWDSQRVDAFVNFFYSVPILYNGTIPLMVMFVLLAVFVRSQLIRRFVYWILLIVVAVLCFMLTPGWTAGIGAAILLASRIPSTWRFIHRHAGAGEYQRMLLGVPHSKKALRR